MKGMDAFLTLFGDITVSKIVVFVAAIIFLFSIYKEVKKYIETKIKEQEQKTKQEEEYKKKINDAWNETQKYPMYRAQSIQIQSDLETKISGVRDEESNIMKEIKKISDRIAKIEEGAREREKNRLRDLLIKYYKHYTSLEANPSQSWTDMEKMSYDALLKDYEELGGNDYIHLTVDPAMKELNVIYTTTLLGNVN